MMMTIEPFHAAVAVEQTPGLNRAGRPAPYCEVAHRRLYLTVLDALDRGESRVVMDCSSWESLDIRLLSSLVHCARKCGERGASFELLNVRGSLRACIQTLRFDRLLGMES